MFRKTILLIFYLHIAHCYQIFFFDFCKNELEPDPFPITGEKSSGSIFMSKSLVNGSWYLPDMNCSVTISAEANYQLFLTFSKVSLRNSSMDNLTIEYDSGKSSMVLSGQQVCSNENCEGLKFDSGQFHNITLKFLSFPNITIPQNMTGFQAYYTVYEMVDKNKCPGKNQFLCGNGHCIWNELKCNGHNNCEDRSDEIECSISVRDTIWGIVIIVLAILAVAILVPLFICLATYGTKNIVKSITLSNDSATPLVSATECGETSGLLTSSDAINNCWPGTSYDRNNSFSYGTSQPVDPDNSDRKKNRSVSVAGASQSAIETDDDDCYDLLYYSKSSMTSLMAELTICSHFFDHIQMISS